MEQLLTKYIAYLQVEKNASPYTVRNYRHDIGEFLGFLREQGMTSLDNVDRQTLRGYMAHLAESGMAKRSVARNLSAIRSFYRYLVREKLAASAPLEGGRGRRSGALKLERRLPSILSPEEVRQLLEAPSTTTPQGQRDRAILELLYASGLRVSELASLDIDQIDIANREIRVWGKGAKERLALMGKPAAAALRLYLQQGRPQLLGKGRGRALFINRYGERLTERMVQHLVKRYAKKAGLNREVRPHLLRHSFATHLLDGGADLRVVQELLGHASLGATQVYTQVAQSRARRVYDLAHPRAKGNEEEGI